jgi:hypothetical protein
MHRFFVIACLVVIGVAATYAATTQSSNSGRPRFKAEINGVTPTATPPPTPTSVPTPPAR